MNVRLLVLKALGAVFGAVTGITASTMAAYASANEPVVILVGLGAAVATGLAVRRVTSSIIASSRETVEGLRQENERLRALLATREHGTQRPPAWEEPQ